jgi:hypothetical protein
MVYHTVADSRAIGGELSWRGNRPHWAQCESTIRVLEFYGDRESLTPWPEGVLPSVHISRSFGEILRITHLQAGMGPPETVLDVKSPAALPSHDSVFPEWAPLHGWDDEDDIRVLPEVGSVIGECIPRARLLPLRLDGTSLSGDD